MARFKCALCGHSVPTAELAWRCDRCGGHFNIEGTAPLQRSDIDGAKRSLWRYQHALAYQGAVHVSLGEGWTPLIENRWDPAQVHWKCEFVSTSGSFKDRGTSVMLNHLIDNGVKKVAEDSSGNAGAAVATYAAAADLGCRIYVPEATSPGKITQIAATGAEVIRIGGSRQAVADAAMADDSGYFYASHNWHPMFVDGIKTVGYELWEQFGFTVPDAIVAPTGGGSNLLGCYLGFSDLKATGAIDQLPRLYGAQSESCEPIAKAFAAGAQAFVPVESRPTIAEGIAVSQPVRSRELLSAIRESKGAVRSVPEDAIAQAHMKLSRRGIYVEPTTATAVALLDRLLQEGEVRPHERIVVILTGSGLKAGDLISKLHARETERV
jgi:threonine synthase